MATTLLRQEFDRLASEEQIARTVQALESKGMRTLVLDTGEQARAYVLSLIPSGVEVYNPPSRTLDQIGLTADIESSVSFQPLRTALRSLDRKTQRREISKLTASPDVVVGSVHAITEQGEVLIASATGSQLSSAVSGAGKVIWVVGTQKLVRTLEDGFRRIREYSYPLEDMRTRHLYGQPSAMNKILVVYGELPDRITIVLVRQNLGF
jgi:YkgG family uncharacterized protein